MPLSTLNPPQVFVSYSHKDGRWLERIKVFLTSLEKEGVLRRWDDTEIDAGRIWTDEIKKAIACARVAVLLVSEDFLASRFISENELPPLLVAAKERGLLILPVIVSHCRFNDSLLGEFHAINPPDKPLNMMQRGNQDKVLVKVVDAIRSALQESPDTTSPSPSKIDKPGLNENGYLRDIGLEKTASRLQYEFDKVKSGGRPSLRSAAIAMDAYLEALELTQGCLYVTTFLHSEFWSGGLSADIVAANSRLSQRVKAAGGVARRIFLIDEPLDSYITHKVEEALLHQDAGDPYYYDKLEDTNHSLAQLAKFFEMKILHVDKLPPVLKDMDPKKYELALYDQFRIDRFRVDNGSILEVEILPKNDAQFDVCLSHLQDFFERAWQVESECPIEQYPEMVRHKMEECKDQVQYTSNWLLQFDHLVRRQVPTISIESRAVEQYIRSYLKREKKESFERYLDVGVCTGRYPTLLAEQGKLVDAFDVLDRDDDSETFLQIRSPEWNFIKDDIRMAGVRDSLNPPYNLITCMMATVSHFGLDNRSMWNARSGFFHGLKNMVEMLDPAGLLIFSVWSRAAVAKGSFLEIYTNSQRKRLSQNNPDQARIRRVLHDINSANIQAELIDILTTRELDIYIIRRMR
jgi:TIR domain